MSLFLERPPARRHTSGGPGFRVRRRALQGGRDLLGLLARATSHFITCTAEGIDDAIERTLADIGMHFGVDRAYLFLFSGDLASVDNSHEWCAAGVEPQIAHLQGIAVSTLPWWMAQMRARRPINLRTLAALPAEAVAERELLERQAIRSLLVVPMLWGDRLEGFAGFDHVRGHRVWTDEEVAVLRILVNAMAQAFERRRREEAATRLARLAFHDPLTRLPNRMLLAERLGGELARARLDGAMMGIAYLDLDGFKPINDDHGHAAGDRLLVEVARRMVESVRQDDMVARIGGDEFVVLLPGLASIAEGVARVGRLQRAMAAPVAIAPGLQVQVRASAGLRVLPPDEADADTLLRQADKAMYAAKQEGLARVHVYDPRRHAERGRRAGAMAVQALQAASRTAAPG